MSSLLLRGGLVVDGTDRDPRYADLLIENGRIVSVATDLDADHVIDCDGSAIIPGLIDCHVHLTTDGVDPMQELEDPFSLQFFRAAQNMTRTLSAGITTVRDAGGADLGVRVAQERGLIPGPRVQLSITMISQTGGHNDPWEASGIERTPFVPHPGRPGGVADGPDQVRRKVREVIRAGADVIKIATSGGVLSARDDPTRSHFRDAEVRAIVEEANAAGVPVMAHAGATEGVKIAVRNGVRSIEHGDFLDDEAIAMMLERGTWLVPTLLAAQGVLDAAEAGVGLGSHIVEKAHLIVEQQRESIRRAIQAGVKIAFGTDSGVTAHGENLKELMQLTECTMTPRHALQSAMLPAGTLLGLEEQIGSLEPPKSADVVVVRGDPFEFDDIADRIRGVLQAGILVAGSLTPQAA